MLYNRIQAFLCRSYWDMIQCRDLEALEPVLVAQELELEVSLAAHALHQDPFK